MGCKTVRVTNVTCDGLFDNSCSASIFIISHVNSSGSVSPLSNWLNNTLSATGLARVEETILNPLPFLIRNGPNHRSFVIAMYARMIMIYSSIFGRRSDYVI